MRKDFAGRDQARWVRDRLRAARNRATVPYRRRRYLERVPADHRRIEIGSGMFPTAGYFHIDANPWLPQLEAVAPMWKLPLPDDWAVHVQAIHSLEHVEPPHLIRTLQEWRRVLRPGGTVHISVPNGPAIMAAFNEVPVAEKWPLMGSVLGMYCEVGSRGPESLKLRSDHQIVFDVTVLEWALSQAGFTNFEDLTETTDDRHSLAWRPMVDHYSLIVRAAA
jgi:SAM-dependent methyltransferase